MKIISKILQTLRRIFGWILTVLGGFLVLICLLCMVCVLFGWIKGDSFRETVLLLFGFLIWTAGAAAALLVGLRLKRRKPKAEPEEQPETPKAEPIMQMELPEAKQPDHAEPSPNAEPPKIPDLPGVVESGIVGRGTTDQRYVGPGEIAITTTATDQVQYHYFADGRLIFTGSGETKSVDVGGFDGRMAYEPEAAPWSELVKNGATTAIFTEGITVVGSGLLDSLKNLEVLELADSVTAVHYSTIRKVHILRTGKNLRSFCGFTAPLTELQVPDGPVHFEYFNSGSLPGVTSKDPAIQRVLREKLSLEFRDIMGQLLRGCPDVARHMGTLPQYDERLSAGTIFSLNWNSKYKKSRYIPEFELKELYGTLHCGNPDRTMEITLKHSYGIHEFVLLAALVHAALQKNPKKIQCNIDYMQLSAGIFRWWTAEFPKIELHIIRSDGVAFTNKGTGGIHAAFSQRKLVEGEAHNALRQVYQSLFLLRDEIGHRDWIGIDTENGALYGMRLKKAPYYDTRDCNEPVFFQIPYANLPELIEQAPQEEFSLGAARYRHPRYYAGMTRENWETYLTNDKVC